MYKIGYISDDHLNLSGFEVEILNPINNLCEKIVDSNLSALLIDYPLKGFSVNEIIKTVHSEKHDFPMFILAADEEEAMGAIESIDIIVEKGKAVRYRELFLRRLKKKIDNYYERIGNSEKELLHLLEKSRTIQLSAKEEERLIDLDTFLEHSMNKKSSIPKPLKRPDGLKELLKKADEILKKIKEQGQVSPKDGVKNDI